MADPDDPRFADQSPVIPGVAPQPADPADTARITRAAQPDLTPIGRIAAAVRQTLPLERQEPLHVAAELITRLRHEGVDPDVAHQLGDAFFQRLYQQEHGQPVVAPSNAGQGTGQFAKEQAAAGIWSSLANLGSAVHIPGAERMVQDINTYSGQAQQPSAAGGLVGGLARMGAGMAPSVAAWGAGLTAGALEMGLEAYGGQQVGLKQAGMDPARAEAAAGGAGLLALVTGRALPGVGGSIAGGAAEGAVSVGGREVAGAGGFGPIASQVVSRLGGPQPGLLAQSLGIGAEQGAQGAIQAAGNSIIVNAAQGRGFRPGEAGEAAAEAAPTGLLLGGILHTGVTLGRQAGAAALSAARDFAAPDPAGGYAGPLSEVPADLPLSRAAAEDAAHRAEVGARIAAEHRPAPAAPAPAKPAPPPVRTPPPQLPVQPEPEAKAEPPAAVAEAAKPPAPAPAATGPDEFGRDASHPASDAVLEAMADSSRPVIAIDHGSTGHVITDLAEDGTGFTTDKGQHLPFDAVKAVVTPGAQGEAVPLYTRPTVGEAPAPAAEPIPQPPVIEGPVPYGAAKNINGPGIVRDPRVAPTMELSTGRTVDVDASLIRHETREHALMAKGMPYAEAHEQAQAAEHAELRRQGYTDAEVAEYEAKLEPQLQAALAAREGLHPDAYAEPYHQEGDTHLLTPKSTTPKETTHAQGDTAPARPEVRPGRPLPAADAGPAADEAGARRAAPDARRGEPPAAHEGTDEGLLKPDRSGTPRTGVPEFGPGHVAVDAAARRGDTPTRLQPVEQVGNTAAVFKDPDSGKFFIASGTGARKSSHAELVRKAGAAGKPIPWYADLTTPHDTLAEARAAAKPLAYAGTNVLRERAPTEGRRGPRASMSDDSARKWLGGEDAPPELKEDWSRANALTNPEEAAIARKAVLADAKDAMQARLDEAAAAQAPARPPVEALDEGGRQALGTFNGRLAELNEHVANNDRPGLEAWQKTLAASPEAGDKLMQALLKRPDVAKLLAEPWTAANQERINSAVSFMSKELAAKFRLAVPDPGVAVAREDGLADAQRSNILRDFAKAMGVDLEVHPTLEHNGEPVLGFSDGDTVHLAQPRNVLEGLHALAHETVHDVIADMPPESRAALEDSLRAILASTGPEHEANVKAAWGKLLGPEGDAWMHEALADAGAREVLRSRSKLLALLPDHVAAPIRAVFKRIADSVRDIVRRLSGLKGARRDTRQALTDLARELLVARRVKIAAEEHGPAATFHDAVAAGGPTPAQFRKLRPGFHDESKGTFGAGIYDTFERMKSGGGSLARNVHLEAWAEMQGVSEHSPAFGRVARVYLDAERTRDQRLMQADEQASWLSQLPEKESVRLGKMMSELRVASIKRVAKGDKPYNQFEAESFLRQRGASKIDIANARKIRGLMRQALQWERQAKFAEANHPIMSADELGASIKQLEAGGLSDSQRLQTLKALHTVIQSIDATNDAHYIPFMRMEKGYTLVTSRIKPDGTKGETLDRRSATAWEADKVGRELAQQYPGTYVAKQVDPAYDVYHAPLAGAEEAIRKLAAQSNMSPEVLQRFLDETMPALVRGKLLASKLHADGIPGMEYDLRKTLPAHMRTVIHGLQKSEFVFNSRDHLAAINSGTDEGVKTFTAAWMKDVLTSERGTMAKIANNVRMAGASLFLSTPASGICDTLSGLAVNPFMAAIHSGRGKLAVTSMVNHLTTAISGVPQVVREMAAIAANIANHGDAVAHIVGRASGESQVAVHARLLRATGQGDTADALQWYARNSNIIQDPLQGEFYQSAQAPISKFAQRLAQGALIFQTVSGRGLRIATFSSTHAEAKTFTPAEWQRAEELGYNDARDPAKYAAWMTTKLNGHTGKASRPALARSSEGALAYQFAHYPLILTKNLASSWSAIVKDTKANDYNRAIMGMGMMTAMMSGFVAMGGMAGLPFVEPMMDGFANVSHWLPWGLDLTHRRTADQFLGELAGDNEALQFARRGVGSLIGGGWGDTVSALGRRAAPGALILSRLTGGAEVPSIEALMQMGSGAFNGAKALALGDTEGAARNFSAMAGPWAEHLNDLRTASTLGLKSQSSGRTLVRPDMVTTADKAMEALGGTPRKVVDAREQVAYEELLKTVNRPEVEPILQRLVDSMQDPNSTDADQSKIVDQLTSLIQQRSEALANAKTPGEEADAQAAMAGLTPQALRSQLKEMFLNRMFGASQLDKDRLQRLAAERTAERGGEGGFMDAAPAAEGEP